MMRAEIIIDDDFIFDCRLYDSTYVMYSIALRWTNFIKLHKILAALIHKGRCHLVPMVVFRWWRYITFICKITLFTIVMARLVIMLLRWANFILLYGSECPKIFMFIPYGLTKHAVEYLIWLGIFIVYQTNFDVRSILLFYRTLTLTLRLSPLLLVGWIVLWIATMHRYRIKNWKLYVFQCLLLICNSEPLYNVS